MTCYICGQEATSVEHAPAKCFFPEDRRINLITVNSCAVHNEQTSKDDEYVRNIIAMSIDNNQIAINHFLKKCVRSFERSPKLLQSTTAIRRKVFYEENLISNIQPTYAFGIERKRIDFVMRKIAYAIFFKKFNTTWNRELKIGTESLRTSEMHIEPLGILIQEAKKDFVIDLTDLYEGNNQEVFKFIFLPTESEDINDQLLIMKFYEGFEIWVFPQTNTKGPIIQYT